METIKIPIEYRKLFDNDWREAAVFGGRFSLKSHTVARYLLVRARMQKTRVACFREFQNSIAESSHQLLADLIREYQLNEFEITDKTIINKINGSDFIFRGLHRNEQSIKSIEGIDIAWCFIAGTKIGKTNIEDIKIGDFVESYNHKTCKIEYRKVLKISKRKSPKTFYRVLTQSGGKGIIGTEEHPVFVKNKGYIPINQIRIGDIVYEKVKLARNGRMFGRLWGKNKNRHSREKAEVCKKWRDFLLGLCKKQYVQKNDRKKSNAKQGVSGKVENIFKKDKSQTRSIGRKWEGVYDRSKHSLRKIGERVVERISCFYGGKKKSIQSPDKLQDRFGKCFLYACDRMRWWGASREAIENGGREERYILKEFRVDHIEVQKQTDIEQLGLSDGGNYVYNFEVEVNNNYFANGILVHNCEEAQSISRLSLEVLTPTIRKPGSKIIYTYNRLMEDDPVHIRLVSEGRPNTLIINVNYDIAEKYGWLPPVIKEEIESDKENRPALYRHKWLGEPNTLEKKIYKDWLLIDQIPHEARLYRYGMDFGYSNDPTVIIAIYEHNGGYILDEVVYQKGLSNKSIADIFLNREKALIIADSSEPKSIDEIYNYGVNIIGAEKGQGSVFQGIQFVQGLKISVTARSVKTWKAYLNYLFKEDRSGKILNEPDDTVHEWSNPMDALRYGFNGKVETRKTTDPYFALYGTYYQD